MNEQQKTLSELEIICQQQYEEIERKKIQLWDLEEENRVLRISEEELRKEVDKHLSQIDELGRWCARLQGIIDKEAEEKRERENQYGILEKRSGIFFRIARKIKRILVG